MELIFLHTTRIGNNNRRSLRMWSHSNYHYTMTITISTATAVKYALVLVVAVSVLFASVASSAATIEEIPAAVEYGVDIVSGGFPNDLCTR